MDLNSCTNIQLISTQHIIIQSSHHSNSYTPKENYHMKEVESHKSQKAKLNVKFEDKGVIFKFYNTLKHITWNFNIPLCPL